MFPFLFSSSFCGVCPMLIMSGEGEVRSSELKTSLSSSEDRRALEVTSPSTPNKA